MAQEDPQEERDDGKPHMTPPEIDYTHLPEQTAYGVDIENAGYFEFENVRTYPVVLTNEFKFLYYELTPPGGIDWHTHGPSIDQVNYCLEGHGRMTLEQEDGTEQAVDFEEHQLVYIPAGARHKLEAVGDELFKGISVYQHEPLARLEMLEGFHGYDSITDWPVAVWVDRQRDELVKLDEDAAYT